MAGQDGQNNQTAKLTGYSDIQHGPIGEANRQCRDLICLILFATMTAAMVYLSIWGYTHGNIDRIFRATDQFGNVCGDPTGAAVNFPYSYFYNPTTFDLSKRYCVASCPTYSGGALTTLSCYQGSCPYALSITTSGTYTVNPTTTSQIIGYETTAVVGRVCIPSSTVFSGVFVTYINTFSTYLNQSDLSSFSTDITNNWKYILAAGGIAVAISFIFMYVLRCLAGLIVWTSIIGIIVCLTIAGFVFLYNAGIISNVTASLGFISIPTLSFSSTTVYEALAYICFGLAGIVLLALLCCFSRIRLAVAVCKAAGQFVVNTCFIVLVPIIQTVITLAMWAVCIVAMLYLISSAAFVVSGTDVFTKINNYGDSNLVQFYCFVFGTLWLHAFIQAVGIFVIASACCMWYYSHGPDQEVSFPILRSYKMVFRYHLGSLAFGSLLLAIVRFMQLVVQIFKKQAQSSGASNKCLQIIVNCLRCFLACVERIVEFINTTAYIQIALRGKNFCNAAKDGFELVWSNPVRFAIVGGVGNIIMFLGKLMIAAATTLIFYFIITYETTIKANILQPIYLLVLVFIISYAIGILFMSVYSLAMDTVFQCFIVDETNQKAKGGKQAVYAPEELRDLMDATEDE